MITSILPWRKRSGENKEKQKNTVVQNVR